MCIKIQYETYKAAKDAQKQVSSKLKQRFRIYKCQECGFLHLTSIKPRKKPSLPKGLDRLNHDADILKLKKQIEQGEINKPPPKKAKWKNKPVTATFKIGDLYPNMKTQKKK